MITRGCTIFSGFFSALHHAVTVNFAPPAQRMLLQLYELVSNKYKWEYIYIFSTFVCRAKNGKDSLFVEEINKDQELIEKELFLNRYTYIHIKHGHGHVLHLAEGTYAEICRWTMFQVENSKHILI